MNIRRLFTSFLAVSLLSSLFSLAASPAMAGPRVGNGGAGWVCQDRETKTYRWIRLVDLFEAENEFGLKVPQQAGSYREILGRKLDTLRLELPGLHQMLTTSADQLERSTKILADGSTLTRIDDGRVRVPPSPRSCEGGYLYYGQLANFTDDGRLLINGAYFNQKVFSETDRAGLLLHEILYKSLRDRRGDTNSTRARQLVGLLFSDLGAKDIRRGVDHVLSLPAPKEDKSDVVLDTFEIRCRAATTSAPNQFAEHKFPGALQPGARVTTKLAAYQFEVDVHPVSGLPSRMAIFNFTTGMSTFLDSDIIEIVLAKRKTVSLSLDHDGNVESAMLACDLKTIEPSLFPRALLNSNPPRQ